MLVAEGGPAKRVVDVVVTLSGGELTAIQGSSNIANGIGTTFLSIAADSVEDMSNNLLTQVDHLMLGPVLLRSTLSFVTGSEQLQLIFSEDVLTSSFDCTGLTLFGTLSTLSYTLSDSALTTATAALSTTSVLTIDIGPLDIISLKTYNLLAVTAETSRLGLSAALLSDTAASPNPVVPIVFADGLLVNQYKPDATVPTLLSIDMNLNEGNMVFKFDEPIDEVSDTA